MFEVFGYESICYGRLSVYACKNHQLIDGETKIENAWQRLDVDLRGLQ